MRLFGLIGFPLTHSFSRNYFSRKFEEEGLTDCRYELFSIPSIIEIAEVLSSPGLQGLNVTIPYKQKVLPYLDSVENLPAGLDACNCIQIVNGQLIGFNTDVMGFERSFVSLILPHDRRALVLGSGGASRAIQFVLGKLGIDCRIISRAAGEGRLAYSDLNEDVMAQHSIIINTTPVGTYPAMNDSPLIPYDLITKQHYLFDVVYNPGESVFLAKGKEKGARIKNGYEMLEIQAEESWKIWNRP